MPIASTIEERLAAVEKAVAELQQGKAAVEPKHGWVEKITGTFKDDPEFGEILRLGQEIRQAEKLEALRAAFGGHPRGMGMVKSLAKTQRRKEEVK